MGPVRQRTRRHAGLTSGPDGERARASDALGCGKRAVAGVGPCALEKRPRWASGPREKEGWAGRASLGWALVFLVPSSFLFYFSYF